MMTYKTPVFTLFLFFLAIATAGAASRYEFIDLSPSGSTMSWANDVAADGSLVGNALHSGLPGGQGFVATTASQLLLPGLVARIATTALSVNSHGQVVGSTLNRAARWDAGVLVPLATPSGYQSQATAINDGGVAVGQINSRAAVRQAVRWDSSGRAMTALPGLSSSGEGIATALNTTGQVAGASTNASGQTHAVVWQGGRATDLGTLGGTRSSAEAINDLGQTVGYSRLSDETVTHGFLWDGATLHDLGSPAGNSRAWDINNQGQIVGDFLSAGGAQHALIWDDMVATDLNGAVDNLPLGWLLTSAQGINDSGQIAVIALDDRFQLRAALLTPVPLPAPFVMMFSALLMLAALRRRRSVLSPAQ